MAANVHDIPSGPPCPKTLAGLFLCGHFRVRFCGAAGNIKGHECNYVAVKIFRNQYNNKKCLKHKIGGIQKNCNHGITSKNLGNEKMEGISEDSSHSRPFERT